MLSPVFHHKCPLIFPANTLHVFWREICDPTTSQSEIYKTSQSPFAQDRGTVPPSTERSTSGPYQEVAKEVLALSTSGAGPVLYKTQKFNADFLFSALLRSPSNPLPTLTSFLCSFLLQSLYFCFPFIHILSQPTAENISSCVARNFRN